MNKWSCSINWFGLLLFPIWIIAFIKTWGTPVFWVLLILAIKDFTASTTFEWEKRYLPNLKEDEG